jgi:hypothetical protein
VHGGAPHLPGTPPPPHVCPVGHIPQSIKLPQPSPIGPHVTPCAEHVVGVQLGVKHWLFEQSWFVAQVPQPRMLPQPSEAGPHCSIWLWHVAGVQLERPQTLGVPPPPHD